MCDHFSAALADTGYPFELRHLTLKAEGRAAGCALIEAFPDDDISALIVTGMEPSTNDLRDEPLWPRLASLHDWCERNCRPVIWSCLSAHAAVQHRGQIGRRRRDTKLSGIFQSARTAADHPLLKDLPEHWNFPHSRHNDLPEDALTARGYTILSQAGAAGVDIFTRSDGTPFFYFQGHPEYRPDTLLREFMRDTRRYLSGESKNPPALPTGYPESEVAHWLARQERAAGSQALADWQLRTDWRQARRQLFKNWMGIAAAFAGRSLTPMREAMEAMQVVHILGAKPT